MKIYTLMNKILFEEEDWYYPYLDIVLRHINDKNLNINAVNKFIIEKTKVIMMIILKGKRGLSLKQKLWMLLFS